MTRNLLQLLFLYAAVQASENDRCYEARPADFPGCSGYEGAGYTCAGDWCASINPTGTPSTCATLVPRSSSLNLNTGRCIITSPDDCSDYDFVRSGNPNSPDACSSCVNFDGSAFGCYWCSATNKCHKHGSIFGGSEAECGIQNSVDECYGRSPSPPPTPPPPPPPPPAGTTLTPYTCSDKDFTDCFSCLTAGKFQEKGSDKEVEFCYWCASTRKCHIHGSIFGSSCGDGRSQPDQCDYIDVFKAALNGNVEALPMALTSSAGIAMLFIGCVCYKLGGCRSQRQRVGGPQGTLSVLLQAAAHQPRSAVHVHGQAHPQGSPHSEPQALSGDALDQQGAQDTNNNQEQP